MGSSRKSLADTSVTSTADLSIFSGGEQRSQQAYSLTYDNDNKSMASAIEDADGESSPGSVVARSSSALMLASTTTPRAMSPDVVRIYVPPAPPGEMEKLSNKYKSQETICPTIVNKNYDSASLYGSRRNSQSFSITSLNIKSIDDGNSDYVSTNGIYSSSSRRGSMSRKSPSPLLDNEYIIECSHFKGIHRRSTDNLNSLKLNISASNISESNNKNMNSNSTSSNMRKNDKHLTSFEELAIKKNQEKLLLKKQYHTNSYRLTKSEYYDEDRSPRYYSQNHNYPIQQLSPDHQPSSHSFRSEQSPRKNNSDYNIKYMNSPLYDDGEKRRRQNSSDIEDNSPYSKKDVYSRFYNDDCFDDENDKLILYKSSDDSLSSPQNTKSVLNTPINEIAPLINEKQFIPQNGDNKSYKLSPTSPKCNDIGDIDSFNMKGSSNYNSFNNKKQSKIPLYQSPVVSPNSNYRQNKSSLASNNNDSSINNFNNSKSNNVYSVVNEEASTTVPTSTEFTSNKTCFEYGNNSKIAMPISGYYSSNKSDANKIKIKINNQNKKQSEGN